MIVLLIPAIRSVFLQLNRGGSQQPARLLLLGKVGSLPAPLPVSQTAIVVLFDYSLTV